MFSPAASVAAPHTLARFGNTLKENGSGASQGDGKQAVRMSIVPWRPQCSRSESQQLRFGFDCLWNREGAAAAAAAVAAAALCSWAPKHRSPESC